MTDPFEALREPVSPVDPDPYFAEALRQRIVIQLQQPDRWVGPHLRVRHTLIVVRAASPPTARAELSRTGSLARLAEASGDRRGRLAQPRLGAR